MQSSPERRRSERLAVDIPCQVMTERSQVAAELRFVDLSVAGGRIESGLAPAAGEVIALSFTPDSVERELTLFARVTHVMKRGFSVRGFGVRFVGLSEAEQRALERGLHGEAAA